MKTSLKDWPKVYEKIKRMRRFDEKEKVLFARFAAATLDERAQMDDNAIKAVGLWGGVRSVRELERRKAKLRRMGLSVLWRHGLSDEEKALGGMFGVPGRFGPAEKKSKIKN